VRVSSEAGKEERRWEALWSYRANPPTEYGTPIPIDSFMGQLGLSVPKEPEPVAITDDEIDRLMKAGRMGWLPPRR